jgi:hypothetical protein
MHSQHLPESASPKGEQVRGLEGHGSYASYILLLFVIVVAEGGVTGTVPQVDL